MKHQEKLAAAERLKLPQPWRWTVTQAREAEACTGCTARYVGDLYVVDVRPGCPAHSSRVAA